MHGVYICQNAIKGAFAKDLQGYSGSWCIGSIRRIDLSGNSVTHFRHDTDCDSYEIH